MSNPSLSLGRSRPGPTAAFSGAAAVLPLVAMLRCAPWAALAAVISACDGSGAGAAGSRPDTMGTDGGVDGGDPYGTFDTARPVEVGSQGKMDMIEGNEDLDFFSFEATAGTWVEILSTQVGDFGVSDTTLTLFGPSRKPLAWNQYVDSIRGEEVLARIVTLLPETGTYYVKVSDPHAAPVGVSFGQPYRLSIVDLSKPPDGFAIDAEAGDGAESATAIPFHTWPLDGDTVEEAFAVGTFSSPSDVDVYSFDVGGGAPRLAAMEIADIGLDGNGSSTHAGKVWVTDLAGTAVLARIDNTSGHSYLHPPVDPGKYLLWVSHPGDAAGDRDFYVIRALLGPENPFETAEGTNGARTTAEPLAVTAYGTASTAYVTAHVGTGDVDYFRFVEAPGLSVSTYCSSLEDGSGLLGLHVALVNDTDEILAEATEGPLEPISIEGVPAPATGAFYVRLSKDDQLPDVVGDWVHCAVYAE